MKEIELKFLIPKSRLKGLMRQVQVKAAQTTQMSAHYYDTPKQQLAAEGIGLRIRKEGDTWVQTMKAAGDGLAARLEHNAVLDNEVVASMLEADALMPDLSLYKGEDIDSALAGFKRKKLTKKLTPQYITDIERTTRVLSDGDNQVEVAYDHGEIIHGTDEAQRVAIEEIEFELLSGDVDFLFSVAKTWCKRYKLCLSTVTKAERGGLLINDAKHSRAVSADLDALTINRDDSQPVFIRALVHNCLLHILPNSSAIAAGSHAADHVQQLSMGLRRLCAALDGGADFSKQVNPEWLAILRQTASLLDTYQQLQTLITDIEPQLADIGAPSVRWDEELDNGTITPMDAVQANDFQLTLLELIAFVMQEDTDKTSAKAAGDKLPKVLSKKYDQLVAAVDDCTISSDTVVIEALQQLRCQLIEMRYLSEFAAPLYGNKKSKRWLKRLKKAQQRLQHYIDALQQQQYYAEKAHDDANALYGAGWLQASLEHKQQRCDQQLSALADCTVFW